ncbi:hypothetical protein XENORESO_018297 [Xenotaenia resolanae]|uniref:Uncharacterized protein n=1 Tax=Xenotaenia resolanae TaxID=208358 RepID=A0ABV0VUT6_9TELE
MILFGMVFVERKPQEVTFKVSTPDVGGKANMWRKGLGSHETKIQLSVLNAKPDVCQKLTMQLSWKTTVLLEVPAARKHPHSMMLPPPCFTMGMVFLGWWGVLGLSQTLFSLVAGKFNVSLILDRSEVSSLIGA